MEARESVFAGKPVAKKAGLALLWFLIGMLALSYLSRAVSEALKARVEIGYQGSSVLDESVEGSGVWAVGETQLYTTYYTRRVTRVYIRPGQRVEVGDPLFAYDVSTIKGGKEVPDKTVRAAKRALARTEEAVLESEDPEYAKNTLENARQALAYAEFTYAQTYALQNGGVVRASFSGTVVSCDLTAGKPSAAGSTGITVAPAGVAFTMEIPVEEASKLAPGDEVRLYTEGREEKKHLVIETVAPPDPEGTVVVTCAADPETDRLSGTKQDFLIQKQSGRYEQTIPIAALRQGGGEEYYVLVLTEKETILGTQLTAKAVQVTLLGHDAKLAAVSGGIGPGDKLITTSTKELRDGDYVALKDAD